MKTQSRHSPAAPSPYSHHPSHGSRSHRGTNKPTTSPATSPRAPYSVGQNYPPMLSPTMAVETARAPSPNYFGLVMEPSNDPRESSGLARENWSPSSSVKSFAAALPKQITLDPNPEFEAFKKAADLNRGKSFSLATSHAMLPTSHPTPVRPRPPRWHTYTSDTGSDVSMSFPKSIRSLRAKSTGKSEVDHDSLHDSAYVSSDSKRNSESSFMPTQITATTPFESPRQIETCHQRPCLPRSDLRESRLSLTLPQAASPSPDLSTDITTRAVTLPPNLEAGSPSMISGCQLKELMGTVGVTKMLVLDIRSAQSFAQSRIRGALNLCIPTTLLKRATFNLNKLQQTFQANVDSQQFSKWREMDWIVVYDAHASDKRDAVTAQNMAKKFTNEGFAGNTAILRGGFTMFSASFPELIDNSSSSQSPPRESCGNICKSTFAPVIGGVNLPTANDDHNPFFSNIRQNMDLADGVGQFEIERPQDLESPLLPTWLRDASSRSDHGKRVSNKFLNIELDEQSRMRTAYAAFQPNQKPQECKFQLSGVEKGTKNRYKDILPFEHARVRLKETHRESCDYVNASHLSASRSNKRYIATQGPLPATYEDFWSVIWEQDVRVIVMLTAESEGGQRKCHPYWKGRDFGPIKLKALSEKKASLDIDKRRSESNSTPLSSSSDTFGRRRANTTTAFESTNSATPQCQEQPETPYVTIRKFALSHAAHPFAPMREITHLHFAAWPDFGTPAQPSHLLALIELANVMQQAAMPVETRSVVGTKIPTIDSIPVTWYDEPEQDANSRPMLVHCSAGCGRTGAFCTVDSVIDMLKRQRQANISVSVPRPRDGEGDIKMDAHDDLVSPTAIKEPTSHGFFDRSTGGNDFQTRESLDMDTAWLRDDRVDLIQKTVQDFREQRLSMVQSLRQYVLCYETILEWLNRVQDRTLSNLGGRARSGSLQQQVKS